jgi:hypothetical protein
MAGMAQDFATRFMTEHQQDGHISCITISPTMMNKILKVDAVEKDENMSEMIFEPEEHATHYLRCEAVALLP